MLNDVKRIITGWATLQEKMRKRNAFASNYHFSGMASYRVCCHSCGFFPIQPQSMHISKCMIKSNCKICDEERQK